MAEKSRKQSYNQSPNQGAVELVAWEKEVGFLNIRFKLDILSMLVGEDDFDFAKEGRRIQSISRVDLPTGTR